ncbi:hypothetical protein VTK26DRAFT_6445 [Humicola hyalothermophila]
MTRLRNKNNSISLTQLSSRERRTQVPLGASPEHALSHHDNTPVGGRKYEAVPEPDVRSAINIVACSMITTQHWETRKHWTSERTRVRGEPRVSSGRHRLAEIIPSGLDPSCGALYSIIGTTPLTTPTTAWPWQASPFKPQWRMG